MNHINEKVFCISGIDTDIGKTIITGLIGKYLLDRDVSVITQKFSQTGCVGVSEDILQHRKIMGLKSLEEDLDGTTCPYIFPEPCSPHLAAELVGEKIDIAVVEQATNTLEKKFDIVLLEGVGGLCVPLNSELTLLDYLEEKKYPILLVSSPRLGSINHTLSVLELAQKRELDVAGILYNRYEEGNTLIAEDSKKIFSLYLKKFGFRDNVVDVYDLKYYQKSEKSLDLSKIFGI
jgi:dethiobiotin synthetase